MRDIRLAVEADIPAIHRIETMTFTVPWSEESIRHDILENVVARWLVMEEDGQVVAYAGVWFVLDEGHITNIAVHPEYRRAGRGRQITDALIGMCRENGMRMVTLEVRRSNTAAQNLYHACGFLDVGYRKRYYENSEDALIMFQDLV